MAERKDGPVKPPIIDAKARNAAKSAQSKTTPAASEKKSDELAQKPIPEKAQPKPHTDAKPAAAKPVKATPLLFPLVIGVSSAVLGVVLAFGVAYLGFWPISENEAPPAATVSDVAALARSVSQQQSELDVLGAAFAQKYEQEQVETTRRFEALDLIIKDLSARPQPETVDLSPLQGAIAALKAEVALIDVSGNSGENGVSLETVTKLQTDMNSLSDQIQAIEAVNLQDKTALRDTLANIEKQSQSSNETTTSQQSAVQVSLALSGLNAALFSGSPYVDALNFLAAAQPALIIPADISASASSGLPTPRAVAQRFDDLAPLMIAKRPILQDGTWQENALDRLKAMIALRPSTPVEGDSPDAVMSRLEQAILDQEYGDALALLTSLPQAMQEVSIDLKEELLILTKAYSFLLEARAEASKITSPALLESPAQ